MKSSLPFKRPEARWLLISLIGLSTLLIVWTSYASRYLLVNLDTINYISIAQHYADGYFKIAVNGYWSPLVSWLLAPLIKIGIDGQLAYAAINGLAAIFISGAGTLFIWRQTNRAILPMVLFWAITLPFVIAGISSFTPDLLLAAWALLYLICLVKANEWSSDKNLKLQLLAGGLLGAVGAFGYYIKAFALPFFIVSIIGWAIIRFLLNRKKIQKKDNTQKIRAFLLTPIVALVVLGGLMAPWVGLLSLKYHKLTVGSAFSVNVSNKFEGPQKAKKIPPTNRKVSISKPPNRYATTPTEDRGFGSSSVAVHGSSGFKYYLSERLKAFPYYIARISSMSLFIIPVITLAIIALAWRFFDFRKDDIFLYITLLFIIYMAGYAAITSASTKGGNVRYYWPLFIYALVALCLGLSKLRQKKPSLNHWYILFASLLVIIAWAQLNPGARAFKPPSKPKLQQAAEQIANMQLVKPLDDIASNNNRQARKLAYYLEAQSYGGLGANYSLSDGAVREALSKQSVEYFVYFLNPKNQLPDIDQYDAEVIYSDNLGRFPCADIRSGPVELCTMSIVKLR